MVGRGPHASYSRVLLGEPDPALGVRLFCFPHAGAGASTYRAWRTPLAARGVAVCPVQLPGRETRFRERAHTSLGPLVDDLVPGLVPHLDRPYAVFGHSMGALVAFEVVRALRRRGGPAPAHLYVSGRIAPHLRDIRRALHSLSDAALLAEVAALGADTAGALEDARLLAFHLPLLRADLAVNETYRYVPGGALDVPITAFGGDRDPKVDPDEVAAWHLHTRDSFAAHMISGGHFFVQNALPSVLDGVGAGLAGLAPPRTSVLSAGG